MASRTARSSAFAPVSAQAIGIPWTVAIRCSLKPKK
jgi:hypothetical protein